jgi:hypothetical protein
MTPIYNSKAHKDRHCLSDPNFYLLAYLPCQNKNFQTTAIFRKHKYLARHICGSIANLDLRSVHAYSPKLNKLDSLTGRGLFYALSIRSFLSFRWLSEFFAPVFQGSRKSTGTTNSLSCPSAEEQ